MSFQRFPQILYNINSSEILNLGLARVTFIGIKVSTILLKFYNSDLHKENIMCTLVPDICMYNPEEIQFYSKCNFLH